MHQTVALKSQHRLESGLEAELKHRLERKGKHARIQSAADAEVGSWQMCDTGWTLNSQWLTALLGESNDSQKDHPDASGNHALSCNSARRKHCFARIRTEGKTSASWWEIWDLLCGAGSPQAQQSRTVSIAHGKAL